MLIWLLEVNQKKKTCFKTCLNQLSYFGPALLLSQPNLAPEPTSQKRDLGHWINLLSLFLSFLPRPLLFPTGPWMCGASVPSSLASGHFRDVRKLDTNMCLCECMHKPGHVIKSEAKPLSRLYTLCSPNWDRSVQPVACTHKPSRAIHQSIKQSSFHFIDLYSNRQVPKVLYIKG